LSVRRLTIKEKILEEVLKSSKGNLNFTRPSWNEYFMILAKIAATRSTCLSRPTGAVIVKGKQVLSTGYNGSMPGVAHCNEEGKCFRRSSGAADSGKYDHCRSIHAEANAIAQAAKKGVNIAGAEVYVTLYPCYVCTKLLASAGIKKVYYEIGYISPDTKRDKLWEEALKVAGIEAEEVKLSDNAVIKTMSYLLKETSWRRELLDDGTPYCKNNLGEKCF